MPCFRPGCLFAALLLAGCAGSERNDLKEFVAQSAQQIAKRVEPPARLQPPETLVYQAFEEPDPFSATRTRPRIDSGISSAKWVPPATRQALEHYPLEALRMVGTLQRSGQRWALIRTPDNTVYRVTEGYRLGENFGAIVEIAETAVVLNEHIEDGGGLWTERVASLTLLDDPKTN